MTNMFRTPPLLLLQSSDSRLVQKAAPGAAVPQVMGILGAMLFMRLGLEPLVKALRKLFRASVPWERSSEFHILREVCFVTLNPTCHSGLCSE